MPFTGSHPAAVLPLLGTGLPASALVLGSMSPDLPYYLPVSTSWPTHTALGVVTVDLLLGGLAWLLWHGLLSAPALAHAPAAVRARLTGRVRIGLGGRLRPGDLLLVAVGLIVGPVTHITWDEFSHPGRWGARHLHALAVHWGPLPGYQWVQYASGVVGGAAEAWWLLRWWRRTPATWPAPPPAPAVRVWAALVAAALVGGVYGGVTSHSLREAGFRGVTRGGGLAVAVALVLAVGWHISRRRRVTSPDRPGAG